MESAEDAVISSRPKSVAELKTNPEPTPSLISASCLPRWQRLSRWFSWKPLPGSWKTRGQELRVAVPSPGMLQSLRWAAGSGTDESEEFTAQPPHLPWPETRASPCRGIHFACFLICWSNRVGSVGKAKITFKFPHSPRRLLSVCDLAAAPRLMYLFYCRSSERTEQCYATKKVYKKQVLT